MDTAVPVALDPVHLQGIIDTMPTDGRMPSMSKSNAQPKTRSYVAIAAQMRNSAGAMGGGKRSKSRRDRKDARQAIRRGDW